MATAVKMPQWGMTMKKGKITRWFKKENDLVEKGENLFEVETEKITNIVEAIAGGILFQIVVPAGETVPVKTVVGVISEEGENPDRIETFGAVVPAETAEEKATTQKTPVKASPAAKRLARELNLALSLIAGTGPDGRITEKDVQRHHEERSKGPKITPLAKAMADKEGVDVSSLTGTGEMGKITREDVAAVLAASQQAPEEEAQAAATAMPYAGMRKAIGDNMLASLRNAAQLTCFAEVDVTGMVRFRDSVRDEYKKDDSVRISFNDIIILAVSRALQHHPIMNSTLADNEIILHEDVNMGIAVALKEGLIVPVLKNAHQKGLVQIGREAKALAKKAHEGALDVDEVSGGTFTISNTSMLAVDGFTPILRPPETGILGVGRARLKPAEHKGEIALRWMMVLSLTYNHCVVDGAPAHTFLAHVGRYLRNPYLIMG